MRTLTRSVGSFFKGVKQPKREANHSFIYIYIYIAKVKNVGSFTSIPSYFNLL